MPAATFGIGDRGALNPCCSPILHPRPKTIADRASFDRPQLR